MILLMNSNGDSRPFNGTKIGNYFSINEPRFQYELKLYGRLVLNDLLFIVANKFRELIGEPVNFTSLNRTLKRQDELNKNPAYKAAATSPHVVFLAGDIVPYSLGVLHARWRNQDKQFGNYEPFSDVQLRRAILGLVRNFYVPALERVSRETMIDIRIGSEEYLRNNQSFIHFDVCPEYYAKGQVWHDKPHPEAWERKARW